MYTSPGVVVAYHGCDQSGANEVIQEGKSLKYSENNYDWLGTGIYFWEGSDDHARQWAEHGAQGVKSPAVVGAFIKLGNCLDLLDTEQLRRVKTTYDLLKTELEILGEPLPENTSTRYGISFNRKLDCRVINYLHQLNKRSILTDLGLDSDDTLSSGTITRRVRNHPSWFDSVRGMFPEGKPLYSGAGFRKENHIQLCIRNPNCIIGYFQPRKRNSWYKSTG